MKNRHYFNRKNMIIVLVCVLVAAICVGTAVIFLSRRRYQTVKVESSPAGASEGSISSVISSDNPSGQTGSTQKNFLEEQGISVALQADLPNGLDPIRYIKQAYELKKLLAVESFDSSSDIPVNPAVQFAFCYLYVGESCLVDFKTSAMTYRQATESELREQITLLFGDCPFDLKQSDLYAAGKQCFEMWQPDYSCAVYAAAQLRAAKDGAYQIDISFFEDAEKTAAAGTSTITLMPGTNGGYYLASMT